MLSYKLNDQWEVQVLANNGWDNVADNNTGKSFMVTITYTLNDNTSVYLTGFGGPEIAGNNHDWRKGVDLVITHQCSEKLNTAVQLDYGEDGRRKPRDGRHRHIVRG